MNFADIVALSVWPVAAVCFLLYFKFREGVDSKFAFSIIVSMLVFLPYVFLFYFILPQSRIAYFDLYFAGILFGGYFLAASVHVIRHNPQKASPAQLVFGLVVCNVIGLGILYWGTTRLYGDYFQQRIFAEGRVQNLDIRYYSRAPKEYRVEIGGETFYAIERDYKLLRIGDNVRAEIGQGSHLIFNFTKLSY